MPYKELLMINFTVVIESLIALSILNYSPLLKIMLIFPILKSCSIDAMTYKVSHPLFCSFTNSLVE